MSFKLLINSLSQRDNVVSPKGFKKQNLPYVFIWIIYYAWVVTYATWWTASPFTENVFGYDIRSMMHAVNLFSSAFFLMIIKKEWFVRMARTGAVFIVAGMVTFLTVPSATVQLVSAIIIAVSLGCVNTSIFIPFVFSLNNTEKLYAVTGSYLLICVISLFQNLNQGNNFRSRDDDLILSFAVLIIALCATIFFKSGSLKKVSGQDIPNVPKIPSRIYLTWVFNCAFAILCKGVGTGC